MNRPGRPAGPADDTAAVVLTAALELLLTEGAAALTPQRLHTVTGVSRTTVYRHWPSPYAFVSALVDVAPVRPGEPAGDPANDLHAEIDLLCDRLRDRPVGGFLHALVAAVAVDPAVAELRRRYVADLLHPFRTILRAAGASEPEAADGAAVIASPLLVEALLLDTDADRGRAHRSADLILTGLVPA
ncbi:TetR family transcriptional regulator [Actinocorallia longicatena]|uniref:HTH tetR-type domain-containing protein n=1 Tax=Actinocorallia longicatena TaxID=111803 RepID=A0ABP6QG86_9ACTN